MTATPEEILEEAAAGPRQVMVGKTSVTQHDLEDLIKVADRKAAQTAAANAHMGLRFFQIKPPGSVQ